MSAPEVGGPGARAFYLTALRTRLSSEIKPLLARREMSLLRRRMSGVIPQKSNMTR